MFGLVDLVGTLLIGIVPTVPLDDVAEARGDIVGATTIHWEFSPDHAQHHCYDLQTGTAIVLNV